MTPLFVSGFGPRALSAILCSLALASALAGPARANWLTALTRDAGEVAGASSGRIGRVAAELGPLGKAASYLDDLAGAPKGALAAHATPEGHWEFINRDGQKFTVGTTDEMSRVIPTLLPAIAAGSEQAKLTLYLSEDSVFANRAALDQIPRDADLFVVTDDGAFPLTRAGKGADLVLTVRPKPNLAMDLLDQPLFEETAFLLGRPLNKSNIRTIAVEPGAAKFLSSAPKLDPDTKVPLVDKLDPAGFADGLRAIRGQTALVTGRVEVGNLIVSPSAGSEITLALDDLFDAAKSNDVNLIILQSDAGRQAGGRNWLWQKVSVGGLDAAAETATFGDFLDALAARRGGFKLKATRNGPNRVHVSAVPDESHAGLTQEAGNAFSDFVSHATGEVITKAVDIDARDQSAESELDARLIPGVPTSIQYPYLLGLIAGIAGLATARQWWRKLISEPVLEEVQPRPFSRLERVASELVFVLVFLPVVGLPAFTVQAIGQATHAVLAPLKWVKRKFLTSKA